METIGHFINGTVRITSEETSEVFNPATGEVAANVLMGTAATVEEAVAAAERAFQLWRDEPPAKRAQVMFRFKALLEAEKDRLCDCIGRENGKTLADAEGELQRGIENVEYACGAPEFLKGEYSKNAGPGIDSWSEFQPLGVVAGITPFNFPAMVPLWMFPMAIVCGNAFILKPSERDPGPSLLLAKLLQQAGLPDGVFNVVQGGKEAADALLQHEKIAAVSFVGSTAAAKAVYAAATANGKRCQALGGAKNHAVVMPDADIGNVVNSLLGAAYGSSGQRCMALSVAVCVGKETADLLVEKIAGVAVQLKADPYFAPDSDFGPVITAAHKAKIESFIAAAEAEGAEIVVDGRGSAPAGFEKGFFVGATLIDRVTSTMTGYREEIFGPVLQVVRVGTLEEAMQLIDAHAYGNGTCIYTRDGEAARYFSDRIRVGMVGINIPLPVPVAYQSFGGWKQSLFGDLGVYGPDGMRFYTQRKTITQRWPAREAREKARFSMPVTGAEES